MAIEKINNIYNFRWTDGTNAQSGLPTAAFYGGISNQAGSPTDLKYGPWWSLTDALKAVKVSMRYYGIRLGVVSYELTDPTLPDTVDNRTITGLTEYTFKKSLNDADVEEAGGSGEGSGVKDLGVFTTYKEGEYNLVKAVYEELTASTTPAITNAMYKFTHKHNDGAGTAYAMDDYMFTILNTSGLNFAETASDPYVSIYRYSFSNDYKCNPNISLARIYKAELTDYSLIADCDDGCGNKYNWVDINYKQKTYKYETATAKADQISTLKSNMTVFSSECSYYIKNVLGTGETEYTYNQYIWNDTTSTFDLVQEAIRATTVTNITNPTTIVDSYTEVGNFSSSKDMDSAVLQQYYTDNQETMSKILATTPDYSAIADLKSLYKASYSTATGFHQASYEIQVARALVTDAVQLSLVRRIFSESYVLEERTNDKTQSIIRFDDANDYKGEIVWSPLDDVTPAATVDVIDETCGADYEARVQYLKDNYDKETYYDSNERILVLYDEDTKQYREWVVERTGEGTTEEPYVYNWVELDVDTDTTVKNFSNLSYVYWGAAGTSAIQDNTRSLNCKSAIVTGTYQLSIAKGLSSGIVVDGTSYFAKDGLMNVSRTVSSTTDHTTYKTEIDKVSQMIMIPTLGMCVYRTGLTDSFVYWSEDTAHPVAEPTKVTWSTWSNTLLKDKISLDFTDYSTGRFINAEAMTFTKVKRVNVGRYKLTLPDGTEKELGSETFTEGVVYEDTITDGLVVPVGTMVTASVNTDDVTIDNTIARVLTLY